jgi:AmiR/NasT family two-component response regulator
MKGGGHKTLAELRRAQVLVIHPRDEDGATLLDHLKRLGCEVKAAWPVPASLPASVDTVFVQIDDIAIDQLIELFEEKNPAVIAIVTYESPTSLKAITDLNAHGVISKPLRPLGILTQFALARYRHGYESRLASKVTKLEETLKSRRLVDKGVKLLAQMNKIDEDSAYRLLRDQATAKRCTMASVAETIIVAHETIRNFGLSITPAKD